MNDWRETFLWALAFVLIALVVMAPVGCVMHQNQVLSEMVKNGANPLEARCALASGSIAEGIVCIQLASKKKD